MTGHSKLRRHNRTWRATVRHGGGMWYSQLRLQGEGRECNFVRKKAEHTLLQLELY